MVLFGAGRIGQAIRRVVGKDACCFCDNDSSLWSDFILSPAEAARRYPDEEYVLCLLSEQTRQQVKEQLKALGVTRFQQPHELYFQYQAEIVGRSLNHQQFLFACNSLDKPAEHVTLHMLGVVLTQRCTLKCANCSLLMPHFTRPKHYDAAETIGALTNLSNAVDGIDTVTLLGGEVLLYPDLAEIAHAAASLSNIRDVQLLTNGTIVPKRELLQQLRGNITYVQINDYEGNSDKVDEIVTLCDELDIAVVVMGRQNTWYPIGPPLESPRSDQDALKMYESCPWGRSYLEMMNGKFHLCGYAAASTELGVLQGNDYVDCRSEISREQITELYEKPMIEACKYCNIDFSMQIKRGEQA